MIKIIDLNDPEAVEAMLNRMSRPHTSNEATVKRSKDTDETNGTPTASDKEATEKVKEAQARNPKRGTAFRKDIEFSDIVKAILADASSHAKVGTARHTISDKEPRAIERDSDKLSSSKEPEAEKVQADSAGREPQMDRRLPEDVTAMERFEGDYHRYSRMFQLGNINARDFRKLISHAFTELMESLGGVSKGQGELAI